MEKVQEPKYQTVIERKNNGCSLQPSFAAWRDKIGSDIWTMFFPGILNDRNGLIFGGSVVTDGHALNGFYYNPKHPTKGSTKVAKEKGITQLEYSWRKVANLLEVRILVRLLTSF